MPILTLHLLRLGPFITVPDFVQQLQTHRTVEVLLASRPRYKIIRPTSLDTAVLSQHHDLVLLVRRDSHFWPSDIQGSIMRDYRLDVGVPGGMLASYPRRNGELLAGAKEAAGSLTGALDAVLEKRGGGSGAGAGAGGKAELDEGLLKFMERLTATYGDKPVTMLNLLRFHEGKKGDYQRYGQAFAPIAAKRGGSAKLVGRVVAPPAGSEGASWSAAEASDGAWDEISLVHYPSIRAFCDMLAGEDYQEINAKYRLDALKDTFLMCTTEIPLEGTKRESKM